MRVTQLLRRSVGPLLAVGVIGVLFASAAFGGPLDAGAQTQSTGASEEQVRGLLLAMDRGAAVIRRQLADARLHRDVVRVLCVDDKLNQADLAIRTANDRMEALKSAALQNDAALVEHESTVVQVLHDRVKALVGESNQCIGEEAGFVGDGKRKFELDGSLPDDDPSDHPAASLLSEPPVLTSPQF